MEGIVTLSDFVPFEGVFEPFRNSTFFNQVRVNDELGSIEWPNGADLDADVLYASIIGEQLPDFARSSKVS